MGEGLKKIIFTGFLIGFGFASAADVSPLYFGNTGTQGSQQEAWNYLMNFKLWGTNGIAFVGQNIHFPDESGYVGTATGDFDISQNTNHVIGGPILVGGDLNFTGDGSDTVSSGPVRVLGDFNGSTNGKGKNQFNGTTCVRGTLSSLVKSDMTDTDSKDGAYSGTNYTSCPDDVPELDTSIAIPQISDDTITYSSALSKNAEGDDLILDVPTGDDLYDLYIKSIDEVF